MQVYYACRDLKVGQGRRVLAGEPVPEADSWSASVLRAHLNLGLIEQREDIIAPQEEIKETAVAVEHVVEAPKKSKKKKRSADDKK